MKVAIAGYGIEGEQNYNYWHKNGHDVTIVDEKAVPDKPLPAGASTILGQGAFDTLSDFDLVIRTAGLAPSKLTSAPKVWSATNEFFEKCPAPIVGVTGTKGKGTTASLIASMLEASGLKVHLVGNIGTPALEVLPYIKRKHVVVYELSSFQLWDAKRSPRIAVTLMIEADHLDVHSDMNDYLNAKANITKYQTADDVSLRHPTNELSRQVAGPNAKRYAVADDGQVYASEGLFYVGDHAICGVDALQVVGQHNVENACAAISVARLFSIKDRDIEKGLRAFTGLPHRLKFVADIAGVSYYDDSIATTPGSAIAALKSFSQPKVLILGGAGKGSDYSGLIQTIAQDPSIRGVVCVGANGQNFLELLTAAGAQAEIRCVTEKTMLAIVTAAASLAQPGDIVILSPAAASFDMFKNYADRGDQFVGAVQSLQNA